jgi:hypothetical protein
MAFQNKVEPQNQLPKTPIEIDEKDDISKVELLKGKSRTAARLEELESLPHRNSFLHWAAFTLSLLSLIMLLTWVCWRCHAQGAGMELTGPFKEHYYHGFMTCSISSSPPIH